ncbi:MAG: hypothetical protein QM736_02115 [Vicinamibacterales bacterium]
MRAPLWQQRKRAADLLAVAARFGSFPMLLETYRECLRDYFDMPALVQTLTEVRSRRIRVATVDSEKPSPFAASLLFSYVANFLYDGDAPLAERRAQALAVDQAQLRELLGDAELRDLLDADAMDEVERQLQQLDREVPRAQHGRRARPAARIGDLADGDLAARSTIDARDAVRTLTRARRVLTLRIAGEMRTVAVEDAARYRDALGIPMPPGVPEALLAPVRDPLGDLALRFARTHAPFTAADVAARYGLTADAAESVLHRLTAENRLLEGEFRPGGTRREWTDADVLRMIRRRSLARLRNEVEPVEQEVLGRFTTAWQGIGEASRRRCVARRDRTAAGCSAARVDPRDRSAGGATRCVQSRGPRRCRRGGRSGVGRSRAARRARRTHRPLSCRPSPAPAAPARRDPRSAGWT